MGDCAASTAKCYRPIEPQFTTETLDLKFQVRDLFIPKHYGRNREQKHKTKNKLRS